MNGEDVLTIPAELPRSPANKKIKFIVGGLVIAAAIAYLIFTGIQSTSAYFLTVSELYGKGQEIIGRQVRVSGMVDAETIDYNHKELILAFDVMDEGGKHLPVVFNGPKPDQMREGAEAIIEGTFDGSTFQAKSLLLKCPSRYEEGTIEEIQVEAVR
ncbi:MAG: cytochrome c maturation protein CcmE [Anaerolineae bacterium]